MAKIVFYSSQTGNRGFIPCIKDQMIGDFDYYFLHDNHYEATEGKGWNYINTSNEFKNYSNSKRQRISKMMPKLFFPNAEYTVYVDSKYYLSREFYKLCLDIIQEEKPNWMVPPHESRYSFEEELKFAKDVKKIPSEEINNIRTELKGEFINTNCCWLIRKNNDVNHLIGKKWFDLTNKFFKNEVRDQLTFPFCVKKLYLNMSHPLKELENLSFIEHV
tara:strand:+ start:3092 stop:3745 length:654 start_codon:yes stop_codon:yes gene_type:complete